LDSIFEVDHTFCVLLEYTFFQESQTIRLASFRQGKIC